MAPLDSLPADQRAVLSLVLERGKGYDEIARLLSIDRTSVRERALAAFDALGPQTEISDLRRALITDYLLGQLPPAVAQETRDRLASTPSERAWARVLASELAPISSRPLPEIPAAGAPAPAPTSPGARNGEPEAPVAAPVAPAGVPAATENENAAAAAALGGPPPEHDRPRGSRLGGIILLAGGAIVVIAVVLVIVLSSGGSSSSHASSKAASVSSSTTAASSASNATTTTSGATSGTTPTVVAQINLKPPSGSGSEAGIAEVLKEGAKKGIAIVAQHMQPNSRKPPNAYAVWLYNSSSDAALLGFVNPLVGKSGRLSTAGGLPTNAAHFHKLVITLETKANPKTPGTIVLSGALTGV